MNRGRGARGRGRARGGFRGRGRGASRGRGGGRGGRGARGARGGRGAPRGRGRGRGASRGRGRTLDLNRRSPARGRDEPTVSNVVQDTSHPLFMTGMKLYKLIRRGNPSDFEAILAEVATGRKPKKKAATTEAKDSDGSDSSDSVGSGSDSSDEKEEIEVKAPEVRAREVAYLCNEWIGKQFGDTLLVIACYYNSPDIAKILIKYGANVNARDIQGRTGLFWACRNDSLLTTKLLLDAGTDPNLYNTEDNTTVMWFAAFTGNLGIMRKLVECGFNVNSLINQTNAKTGYNVFHQCCEKGFLECLRYLFSVADKDVIDIYIKTTNHNMNALQLACNNSNVEVVKFLVNELGFLDKEGIVNDTTLNGKTALWYAALDGNLEIMGMLCDKSKRSIDVNKKNDKGNSALYVSSMRNHFECTRWMVTELEDLDVNIQNKDGMSPLMVAVKGGNLKTVEILANHDKVQLKELKDKVGRNIFDYCAKFGQTECLKIILRAMLRRREITTWELLEEADVISVKLIENWIRLAKKHDKGATKAMGRQKAPAAKDDDAAGGAKGGKDQKDGKKDQKGVKKTRKTKNDGVIHFLEDLINGCFKFSNFELLLARLDYANNVTKEEVTRKLKDCEKLNEITNKLFKYCSNKQILIEFGEIVVKMIENKEIVNDTLMMIASRCVPQQLEQALVGSVRHCISGDVPYKRAQAKKKHKPAPEAQGAGPGPLGADLEPLAGMAPFDGDEKNALDATQEDGQDAQEEDGQDALDVMDEDDVDVEEINRKKKEINKEHRQSRRNARDIAWYRECILNSNILSDTSLFEKIKVESIQQELENQQLYLSKQISFLKEVNATSWRNLLNYKEFNISLDGLIQQKRVISKFDATSANMVANNGIPVDYEQKSLFVDYLTGFNMSSEYDNNSYLISLLIAAHKMNPLFQRHCRKLLSSEVLGVPCEFKRAPVKTKQRCQLKAVMDYSDREWPYTSHILDILRCSVVFESPSDLVVGLNKFRTIMKQGLRQQKGCLVNIVRIKNGFKHYLQVNDSNKDDLSFYRYSDIKINMIIEIGNYKMIGEIIFMLDFMTLAKEIGHIFYGFERNEELYTQVNNALVEIDESINDASDENAENNEKYLRMIIGTRNYSLLLSYVLFGRFESEMKKRINKIDFRDMVRFCKDNQWLDGFKLLKDAMAQYRSRKKWWMPDNDNSYLMVDID